MNHSVYEGLKIISKAVDRDADEMDNRRERGNVKDANEWIKESLAFYLHILRTFAGEKEDA